ncbi:MAG TPA: hypothetical protein VH475_01255, partial [Tepidisphaeraceae bacterium]
MPKLRDNQVPSYRRHKQSGKAVVTLNGKDFLLGPHGSTESRKEYDRLIAEWVANGRQVCGLGGGAAKAALTVNELILAYWKFAKVYYRKDGRPTGELSATKYALKPLQDLYGHTSAASFGPLCLTAVRQRMIDLGWARKNINNQVGRIKRLFKWAVSREMVPPNV